MVFLKLEVNTSPGHVLAALGSSGNVCPVIVGIGLCMAVTHPSYLASPLPVFPLEDPRAGAFSGRRETSFIRSCPGSWPFPTTKGAATRIILVMEETCGGEKTGQAWGGL